MGTNMNLARELTQVAKSMTGRELPAMETASVAALPSRTGTRRDRMRAVALWADSFDVPVTFVTESPGELRMKVRLDNVHIEVFLPLIPDEVSDLVTALDVRASLGGTVRVSAEKLLAALHVDQEPVRSCQDEQCVSSGRAALCDTHAPEYFATQRAMVSQVEVAAGGVLPRG